MWVGVGHFPLGVRRLSLFRHPFFPGLFRVASVQFSTNQMPDLTRGLQVARGLIEMAAWRGRNQIWYVLLPNVFPFGSELIKIQQHLWWFGIWKRKVHAPACLQQHISYIQQNSIKAK